MNLKLKRHPGIYLVGFMGSGKSTIGQRLAKELGWSFADTDADIEAAEQTTISEIFEQRGEPEFRRIESAALAERVHQIRSSRPLVVAVGGGAFAQLDNRRLLEHHGVSVWLDCPFSMIQKRIAGFTHRPLARDPESFRKLYGERRPFYAKADYHVPVHGDDPMDAVRHILELPGLF